MPLTDAERDELKTLIRETIREMAKEAGQIIIDTPLPGNCGLTPYGDPTRPRFDHMVRFDQMPWCSTGRQQ